MTTTHETPSVQEAEVITLETTISDKLKKHNVTDAIIAGLREKYLSLTINGQEDRDGYKAVVEARKDCKSWRVLAQKICKEGREDAVREQKAWVSKEREIIDKIKEVEDPLQKMEDEYEAEKARAKAEEKAKYDRQGALRTAELTKLGATFNGSMFFLEDVSHELAVIRESDEDIYQEMIVPHYRAIFDRREAEKAEEVRLQQEKEAEMARQKEEFERQQADLKRQQEELRQAQELAEKERQDRERREAEAQKAKEDSICADRVKKLGPVFWDGTKAIAKFSSETVATRAELVEWSEDQFGRTAESFRREVAAHELNEAEKRKKEIEEKARIAAEEVLKEERRRAAEAEATKQAELERAKDKTKWEEVVKYLNETPVYEMRSGQYRAKMKEVTDFIAKIK